MQYTDAPGRIPLPFADAGGKASIPVDSQIGVGDSARASFTDGFPPVTRIPRLEGGIPPYGVDMNGILFAVSALSRWQSAGGSLTFDSDFSISNGGYPLGAVLLKADGSGFWQSLADNNDSDPDAGGPGWVDPQATGYQVYASPGESTFTVPRELSSGFRRAKVTVVGAGGGAGRAVSGSQHRGPGGGGGGTAIRWVDLTGVETVTVTVGAGGSGSASGVSVIGSTGGTSSFGPYLSASGGIGGGVSGSLAGGLGGVGTGGDINIRGETGSDGTAAFAGGGSGDGGSSTMGGGGRSATADGINGGNYGGGGGGSQFVHVAGSGAGGAVIIEW